MDRCSLIFIVNPLSSTDRERGGRGRDSPFAFILFSSPLLSPGERTNRTTSEEGEGDAYRLMLQQ